MLRSLTALALAGCAPTLGRPEIRYGPPGEVPLVQPSTDTRRWYVPMETAALGPVVWFVDTGYTYSTCDDGLISALGIEPRGRVRIRGELGRVRAQKAKLPPMVVGGHEIAEMVCQVRDLGSTSSLDDPKEVPIAGVFGMDLLSRFRVVFDPREGEMVLVDPGSVPPLADGPGVARLKGSVAPGSRARVEMRIGNERLWQILDTGATNTYVDGARFDLTPSYTVDNVTVRGTGAKGHEVRKLVSYEIDEVWVAGQSVGRAILIDRDRRWWEPGLIGLDLLLRFHQEYDFAHGRVRLTPTRAMPLPQFSSFWPLRGSLGSRLLDEPSDATSDPAD